MAKIFVLIKLRASVHDLLDSDLCNGLAVMTDEPKSRTKTKTLQAKRTKTAQRTNKTKTTKAQRSDKTKTDTKKRARENEDGVLDLFLALSSKRPR